MTWSTNLINVEYDSTSISGIATWKSKTVIINPAYQYIQMPPSDAHIFFRYLMKVYPELDCSLTQYKSCVFKKECTEVTFVRNHPLIITLDDASTAPIKIDVGNLFRES